MSKAHTHIRGHSANPPAADELAQAHAMEAQADKMKAEAKDIKTRALSAKREKLLGFVKSAGYETAEEMAKDLRQIDRPIGGSRHRLNGDEKKQLAEYFEVNKHPRDISRLLHISLPTVYRHRRELAAA